MSALDEARRALEDARRLSDARNPANAAGQYAQAAATVALVEQVAALNALLGQLTDVVRYPQGDPDPAVIRTLRVARRA